MRPATEAARARRACQSDPAGTRKIRDMPGALQTVLEGFDKTSSSYCLGNQPRLYTKHSLAACLAACRSRSTCACVAYRESEVQNCKMVLQDDWRGTTRSKAKPAFDAYSKTNARPASGGGGGAGGSSSSGGGGGGGVPRN